LQRLLARDGYGIGEVADIIAADAALATSVLAVANSALLSGAAPITNLGRAVNRLGARTVGAIAVASGIGGTSLSSGVLLEVRFRVWRRGMTCALACQKLSAPRSLAPEEAFLAGLLYGFGRSIAVASLEQLLKTHQPARPLTPQEWLSIAEQQRAALATAIATSWKLPPVIAEAMGECEPGSSPLYDLVLYADRIAESLDAGRQPEALSPADARLLDELVAALPATLEAFAPPTPAGPTMRPAPPNPHLAKPEHAIEGDLRKKALKVFDRRTKGAAQLSCSSIGPTGIEVDSSRPFQEGAMVRLGVGEPDSTFEPWMTVLLCVPAGSRFRVEMSLFSPTREVRETWRALYDAP
ncbi:MAG TPA: HDOD domain-containing protein, partial [Polyangiaceae bacterium]|nr:HDOD domain-containing protein [Polyangiaceae bacterium]